MFGIVSEATTPIIANVMRVSAKVNAKNFSAFKGGGGKEFRKYIILFH